MALKTTEYFTMEVVEPRTRRRPLQQGRLPAMLFLAAMTLWPDADPRRAEFGLYLQARSFADLGVAIDRPSTAAALPPGLTTRDGRHLPPVRARRRASRSSRSSGLAAWSTA